MNNITLEDIKRAVRLIDENINSLIEVNTYIDESYFPARYEHDLYVYHPDFTRLLCEALNVQQ